MRYQLGMHGWPVGQYLIPDSTIIDAASSDDWSRLARGRIPPLNARPLDDEALQLMMKSYPNHQHWVVPAIGFESAPRTNKKRSRE
jgi:hypothetical protein